jgi:hypothetical protein
MKEKLYYIKLAVIALAFLQPLVIMAVIIKIVNK